MKKMIFTKVVRLDKKTKDFLETDAGGSRKYSAYIRRLIEMNHINLLGIDKSEFMSLRRTLIGIGTNINQIAHNVNSNQFTDSDYLELKKMYSEVQLLRKKMEEVLNVLS